MMSDFKVSDPLMCGPEEIRRRMKINKRMRKQQEQHVCSMTHSGEDDDDNQAERTVEEEKPVKKIKILDDARREKLKKKLGSLTYNYTYFSDCIGRSTNETLKYLENRIRETERKLETPDSEAFVLPPRTYPKWYEEWKASGFDPECPSIANSRLAKSIRKARQSDTSTSDTSTVSAESGYGTASAAISNLTSETASKICENSEMDRI